ncbi:J domain-containing protein [Marinicella meishanensis]|uniref:J domain-containing protein n=1 Tax=Marinicella meishanensis TaxID=2873263 RepID=UPI001CBB1E34|nr:J domain-containing protein [Marinicella sp. NBU2979]
MYPWDVLEITETDDRKAIKKAYARLLRQHRPDSDPEGFQRVNEAYQAALKWNAADWQEPAWADTPPTPLAADQAQEPEPSVHDPEPAPTTAPTAETTAETSTSTESPSVDQVLLADEASWQVVTDILKQFKATAFAPIAIKRDLTHWQFLEQYHDISDLAAREALSEEIFKRIVEYNHFQMQAGNLAAFDAQVVNYCNEVMDWEANWVHFERRFAPAYVQHVYHLIEWQQTGGHDHAPATGWQRLLAWWFDVVVALAASILLAALMMPEHKISVIFQGDYRMITCVLLMLVMSGMQLSRWRKSPGQHINDIKVYDLFGNHPALNMMWIRVAVFQASMSPIYGFLLWPTAPFWLLALWAYLVVMINLFLRYKMGHWLHEWVSGTVAIK